MSKSRKTHLDTFFVSIHVPDTSIVQEVLMDLKRTICTQKKIYLSKENIIGKFIKNYNYLDIDKMSQENIIGKFIKNYNENVWQKALSLTVSL